MKIILPGGAGLVGHNLVIQLKLIGGCEIVVIDKHHKNTQVLRELHPDILIIEDDLSKSGEWEKSFQDADVVVMLQAQIGSKHSEPFRQNNIKSTQNILGVMKAQNTPYLVHISSSVVETLSDDDYTKTKKEQEKMVAISGLDYVTLRPTLMFGWFDRKHLGWLSRFLKKVPIFPIPGNGRFMRQPLYVADFCHIIISCINNHPSDKLFNITGWECIDYVDIIREIRKQLGVWRPILKIPCAVFDLLLKLWALFDPDPPFTSCQLKALMAGDKFEVIPWPEIFRVSQTPFDQAIKETFSHPVYSKIELSF